MKVLWLAPMPSMFKNKYESFIGSGWISSLEEAFRKNIDVDLRVAFSSPNKKYIKHNFNDLIYYEVPVYNTNKFIGNYVRRLFNIIEDEKIVSEGIRKVVEDFDPDIIHIWGSENAMGLATIATNIPHVLHFQGNLNVYFHKYYSAFTKRQLHSIASFAELIKKSSKIYHHKTYKKRVLREQKIFRNCKNIFGRTDWDRNVTKILSPGANYFHCDEALRQVFYENTWQPNENENFIIFSVFRDNIYKGLETIYQASNLLSNNNIKFEWRVAGIDESSISYRVAHKYIHANESVKLLGKKNTNDLLNELKKANLFVHPSHIDNSPNSVCEAMMLGLPVLATAVGGVPYLIENKINGYLIQDGDPWSMSGLISEIIENYSKAIEIGFQARKKALERHDKQKILNGLLSNYKLIVDNNLKNK